MKHSLPAQEEERSEPSRLAEGFGLALVLVGFAQASGLFLTFAGPDTLAPNIFRPLMLAMALMLAFFGALAVCRGESLWAGAGLLMTGLCLLTGFAGLWHFAAGLDTARQPLFNDIRPWTGLFGIAAVLICTWQLWGRSLAFTAISAFFLAAVWHTATWRPGFDWLQSAPVDATLDMAGTLWFSLDGGPLGWVLDVLLSTVFPLFILGCMLVSRTFSGSATASHPVGGRCLAVLHTVSLHLIPTLVMGSIFLMERPGTDLATIAVTWSLALSICFIWFWFRPVALHGTAGPTVLGGRDILLIGSTLLVLALALVAGLSFQLSAIIALGVLIAQSLLDADVRQRPDIILLALARSGIAFGRLLVAAAAVGLILMVLDQTGLPIDVARLLAGAAGEAKFPLLVLATIAAIGMGMIMQGFAAYLIVAALIGPALRTVGIADPTAHLLILVVSAVAVAIGYGARSKAA